MRTISYKDYFDKVFGCWLGKSIAGTIGAPFEGRKELFDYKYDPRSLEELLPNDDLDLQIVWLEVLENKGIYFTSEDLAEAFYRQYPPAYGEYALFKKNYMRGIMPPDSGKFNNRYYYNGMGCPIRSEIWACVAPGNMELATDLAKLDGVLDHGENSVEGEIFLAALESEAFFESDISALIDKAMKHLNPCGNMYKVFSDVIGWCKKYSDYRVVRSLVLENWGHADCTNLYQNMAITLLCMILGEGDFTKTAMMALNCGFDTDCTCATAGSILGIINGADKLMEQGFWDTGFILEALVERRSNTLHDLAEDTCIAGLTMAKYRNSEVEITDAPEYKELPHDCEVKPLEFKVDYCGIPSIGIGEIKELSLCLANNTDKDIHGSLGISLPEGWEAGLASSFAVNAGEKISVPFTVSTVNCKKRFDECNKITVTADWNSTKSTYTFGITGASVWTVYGPFWNLSSTIPEIPYWEKYAKYFDHVDDLREYHISTVADINMEYVDEADLEHIEKNSSVTCSMIPKRVNLYEDSFEVSDITKYQGSCVMYMVRELISDEEKTAVINIGYSAPYKLWVNGEYVAGSDKCTWWTAENTHTDPVKLKKGKNLLVFKAARIGESGKFSIAFCDGLFTNHHYDYASGIDE